MKKDIFRAVENDDRIRSLLNQRTNITDWQSFTRTHFNFIAKEINKNISKEVLENPIFVLDFLLIGKDKVENLKFEFNVDQLEDVIDHLDLTSSNRPFNWISGKTLERYWKRDDVKPKELKLNVLLSFLKIPIKDWEKWKYYSNNDEVANSKEKPSKNTNEQLTVSLKNQIFFKNISNYYLGSYYLYYSKTENKKRIIKTPFIIKLVNDKIVIESTSEGHRYKSSIVKRMMNTLYVSCSNLDWEEDEVFLFNIGLETKPEVIYGVSITLTGKSGIPVAIKNILIKQSSDINFLDNEYEKEIKVPSENLSEEEECVVKYFSNNSESNLIFAEYCNTFDEFKEAVEED